MSAPVVYRSTDASAPVLTGQVGALITVLNDILVAGYGTQPGAGWTESFTGTNGAVWRQGGGNQFYMLVNDNGPGAGVAKEARMFASEGCTAYSATAASSSNLFPTAAQQSAGLILRKSATADATARAWVAVADDRTLYFFTQTGDSAGIYFAFAFGDFYSLVSGDGFRTFACARATASENTATVTNETLDETSAGSATSALAGHYFARGYTATGGAVSFAAQGDGNQTAGVLSGVMPYPNPSDGGVYLSRVYIADPTTSPVKSRRGWMRGFYHFCHSAASVIDGDTLTGAVGSEFAGRTFLVVKGTGNSGVYLIETSNTWDTSS